MNVNYTRHDSRSLLNFPPQQYDHQLSSHPYDIEVQPGLTRHSPDSNIPRMDLSNSTADSSVPASSHDYSPTSRSAFLRPLSIRTPQNEHEQYFPRGFAYPGHRETFDGYESILTSHRASVESIGMMNGGTAQTSLEDPGLPPKTRNGTTEATDTASLNFPAATDPVVLQLQARIEQLQLEQARLLQLQRQAASNTQPLQHLSSALLPPRPILLPQQVSSPHVPSRPLSPTRSRVPSLTATQKPISRQPSSSFENTINSRTQTQAPQAMHHHHPTNLSSSSHTYNVLASLAAMDQQQQQQRTPTSSFPPSLNPSLETQVSNSGFPLSAYTDIGQQGPSRVDGRGRVSSSSGGSDSRTAEVCLASFVSFLFGID